MKRLHFKSLSSEPAICCILMQVQDESFIKAHKNGMCERQGQALHVKSMIVAQQDKISSDDDDDEEIRRE